MNELPEEHEYLGWYAPPEAKKLLSALEEADISVHAEFRGGVGSMPAHEIAYGGFGGTSQILIAVESRRRSEVDLIHSRLFGAGLADGMPEGDWDDARKEEQAAREFAMLERREELSRQLGAAQTDLEKLLAEVAAVDEELAEGKQAPDRLDALRRARERHAVTGSELLATKEKLIAELHEIDKELYGEE